jgi:hypothetical protein
MRDTTSIENISSVDDLIFLAVVVGAVQTVHNFCRKSIYPNPIPKKGQKGEFFRKSLG